MDHKLLDGPGQPKQRHDVLTEASDEDVPIIRMNESKPGLFDLSRAVSLCPRAECQCEAES